EAAAEGPGDGGRWSALLSCAGSHKRAVVTLLHTHATALLRVTAQVWVHSAPYLAGARSRRRPAKARARASCRAGSAWSSAAQVSTARASLTRPTRRQRFRVGSEMPKAAQTAVGPSAACIARYTTL